MLHCAAEGGLSDLVKILVSQDIDINAVDEVRLLVVYFLNIASFNNIV